MKKCYFIFLLFLSPCFSFANVPDTIPNAGFERWLSLTWFDNPETWFTNNNSLLAAGVVKDSAAYSGYLAVKVINSGALVPQLWTSFHLNTRPFSFGGYFKKNILSNDSVIISVHLYYNNIIVDSGHSIEYAGSTSGYVPFSIPISQHLAIADSCDITIVGGTLFTSEISFDDLAFDFSLEIPPINDVSFSVYPNPCSNNLIIQSNFSKSDNFSLEAYDAIGRRQFLNDAYLDNSTADDYIVDPKKVRRVYNISKWQCGLYIIVYRSNKQKYAATIIKN